MATRTLESTNSLGTITLTDDVYLIGGITDVILNLDQSALLAGGLTSFNVLRSWTANIGEAGNPLKSEINTGANAILDYNAGGGQLWYQPMGFANTCLKAWNRGLGLLNIVGGGTVTTLECKGGVTSVASLVTATTVRVGGNARVFLKGQGGVAATTVEIAGGELTTDRAMTTVSQYGGSVIVQAGTNAITTYTMAGGTLNLVQSGTITTMNLIAGDASNINITRPITITTLNIWATVRNASPFVHNRMLTITTTNWRMDTGQNS